jgi:hypothetical protein
VVLKVARTIADLDGAEIVGRPHLAEALAYRAAHDRIAMAARRPHRRRYPGLTVAISASA